MSNRARYGPRACRTMRVAPLFTKARNACGTKVGSVEAPREAHSSTQRLARSPLFANSSGECRGVRTGLQTGSTDAALGSWPGYMYLTVVYMLCYQACFTAVDSSRFATHGFLRGGRGRLDPGTSARCQLGTSSTSRRYLMNPTARRDQYLTPIPRANVTPSHRRLGRSYFSLPGSHWRN